MKQKKEYPEPPKPISPKSFAMTTGNVHMIFRNESYWQEFQLLQDGSYETPYGHSVDLVTKITLRPEHLEQLEEFIRQYKLMMYDVNERSGEIKAFFEKYPDHPEKSNKDYLPF